MTIPTLRLPRIRANPVHTVPVAPRWLRAEVAVQREVVAGLRRDAGNASPLVSGRLRAAADELEQRIQVLELRGTPLGLAARR